MNLDAELGSYISLVTFRRDGSAVATPVWFAECDGKLYVFSEGGAYKVKRLRREPRLRVARCAAFGRVTGPWREGRGRVVDEPRAVSRAYEALRAKYGWQMRLVDALSRLAGRIQDRAILEITLARPTTGR